MQKTLEALEMEIGQIRGCGLFYMKVPVVTAWRSQKKQAYPYNLTRDGLKGSRFRGPKIEKSKFLALKTQVFNQIGFSLF